MCICLNAYASRDGYNAHRRGAVDNRPGREHLPSSRRCEAYWRAVALLDQPNLPHIIVDLQGFPRAVEFLCRTFPLLGLDPTTEFPVHKLARMTKNAGPPSVERAEVDVVVPAYDDDSD